MPPMADTPLLRLDQLAKHFPVGGGWIDALTGKRSHVKAVDGVSLDVRQGETLAIVGESGSGKSTLGRLVMRLLTPTAGQVLYKGRDVVAMNRAELRQFRRQAQIIFQDPFSSLNPRMRIADIVREPLDVYQDGARADRPGRTEALLERVGLTAAHGRAYPSELSGGQRQRVGIAAALALSPELIVADEPTSALDVSVQAQTLNLLADLQASYHLTFVFITHDLGIVHHFADRVAVMYLGRIVEEAPTETLFREPKHPYTRSLLSAIPQPDPTKRVDWQLPEGEPPSPVDPPSGCSFHPRCPHAMEVCARQAPALAPVEPGLRAACFLHQPVRHDASSTGMLS